MIILKGTAGKGKMSPRATPLKVSGHYKYDLKRYW